VNVCVCVTGRKGPPPTHLNERQKAPLGCLHDSPDPIQSPNQNLTRNTQPRGSTTPERGVGTEGSQDQRRDGLLAASGIPGRVLVGGGVGVWLEDALGIGDVDVCSGHCILHHRERERQTERQRDRETRCVSDVSPDVSQC
jgi:hypothetical protein